MANDDNKIPFVSDYMETDEETRTLNEFRVRQVDENRKVSRRMDELDNKTSNIENLLHGTFGDGSKSFLERIISLEDYLSEILTRIDALERMLGKRVEVHECTACDGTGFITE